MVVVAVNHRYKFPEGLKTQGWSPIPDAKFGLGIALQVQLWKEGEGTVSKWGGTILPLNFGYFLHFFDSIIMSIVSGSTH